MNELQFFQQRLSQHSLEKSLILLAAAGISLSESVPHHRLSGCVCACAAHCSGNATLQPSPGGLVIISHFVTLIGPPPSTGQISATLSLIKMCPSFLYIYIIIIISASICSADQEAALVFHTLWGSEVYQVQLGNKI